MFIKHLQIKNFRCFELLKLEFNKAIVLLQGPNGSGKTSLLEALYFVCYQKSFRTSTSSDLINCTQANAFNIQLRGTSHVFHSEDTNFNSLEPLEWNIMTGYSPHDKIFKVNNKSIRSFKSIAHIYRVISLTEDDIMIIKGQPALRRSFIDQSIFLVNTEFLKIFSHYKKILQARNALLENESLDMKLYETWTFQLWTYARIIEEKRIETLHYLEKILNKFCLEFFQIPCFLSYNNSLLSSHYEVFDDFIKDNPLLYTKERAAHRSLFGPHLHNIEIMFNDSHSTKNFSSRGTQKFLVFLLKVAQIYLLKNTAIFLIDDFFVDLDKKRMEYLLSLLPGLNIQLFLTTPLSNFFEDILSDYQSISIH